MERKIILRNWLCALVVVMAFIGACCHLTPGYSADGDPALQGADVSFGDVNANDLDVISIETNNATITDTLTTNVLNLTSIVLDAYGDVNASEVNATDLNVTNADIETLTLGGIASLNATTISGTSATLDTITATTGNIVNIDSTEAYIDSLRNATLYDCNIENATVTTAETTDFLVLNGTAGAPTTPDSGYASLWYNSSDPDVLNVTNSTDEIQFRLEPEVIMFNAPDSDYIRDWSGITMIVDEAEGYSLAVGDWVAFINDAATHGGVHLADANGVGTAPAIGVVVENIDANTNRILLHGLYNAYTDWPTDNRGDTIYLSDVAGDWSTTPSATYKQALGILVYNSLIYVNPTMGENN